MLSSPQHVQSTNQRHRNGDQRRVRCRCAASGNWQTQAATKRTVDWVNRAAPSRLAGGATGQECVKRLLEVGSGPVRAVVRPRGGPGKEGGEQAQQRATQLQELGRVDDAWGWRFARSCKQDMGADVQIINAG